MNINKKNSIVKKPKQRPSPHALITLRVNQIISVILKGYFRFGEIKQYVAEMDKRVRENSETNWITIGVNERTLYSYISQARKILEEEGRVSIDRVKSTYRAMLIMLFQKAVEKDDISTANKIMRNMIYLDGLGSMNIQETFSVINFDVKITEKEEQEYYKRLGQYCKPSLVVDTDNSEKN